MTRHRRWLLATLLVAAPALAQAPQVYRWTGRDGTHRYGDRVQAGIDGAAATPVRVPATPSVAARLRIEHRPDGDLAWVDNLLAGPIEVLLHGSAAAEIVSDPALPARAGVDARQSALVAVIRPGRYQLRLEAVPGSSNASPRRDAEYGYPLRTGALRVQQAWGGRFSHADAENRHAVDFAAPTGTPVLAARDGVVMQVEAAFDDEDDAGADAVDRANFVRILHDDGSMALYAHLEPDGALVRVGTRVRRGQPIARSGNTGFSTGPHLHFVVQVNRGMRLESIPFRMFGPQGVLRFDTVPPGSD